MPSAREESSQLSPVFSKGDEDVQSELFDPEEEKPMFDSKGIRVLNEQKAEAVRSLPEFCACKKSLAFFWSRFLRLVGLWVEFLTSQVGSEQGFDLKWG